VDEGGQEGGGLGIVGLGVFVLFFVGGGGVVLGSWWVLVFLFFVFCFLLWGGLLKGQ